MNHVNITKWARLLFPPSCLYCKKSSETLHSLLLCNTCFLKLIPIQNHCKHCGYILQKDTKSFICGTCSQIERPPIDQLFIGFSYESVMSELIIKMKFHKDPLIAYLCAQLILPLLQSNTEHLNNGRLIPIPIDRFRLALRGFNQSLEIALPIHQKLNIPIQKNILYKRAFFVPQSHLDKKTRKKNLMHAFELKRLPPEHVILIDDVLTTGTTLNTIASLLKQNGTKKITALVISKA